MFHEHDLGPVVDVVLQEPDTAVTMYFLYVRLGDDD